MKRLLRNKLVVCISVLVLMVVSLALAADVVVKEGEIQAEKATISALEIFQAGPDPNYMQIKQAHHYIDFYVDGNRRILGLQGGGADRARFYDYVQMDDALNVAYDLDVDDDLVVGDELYVLDDILLTDDAFFGSALNVSGAAYIHGNTWMSGDLRVQGTFCPYGGVDPPYVLYSSESRQDIVERVQREVPPEKQGGAALFFNEDTHRLEIYIPSEGKFYDLQSNLLASLTQPAQVTIPYETQYFLDPKTGQVTSWSVPVQDRYVVKTGYKVDEKTGQFINLATQQVVSRDEALEVYVESENSYHDLDGNLLRTEPADTGVLYVERYYLDRATGQVRTRMRPVHDEYVIKAGFILDEDTGEFKDEKTGEVVPEEEAVELIKAADIVAEMTQQ